MLQNLKRKEDQLKRKENRGGRACVALEDGWNLNPLKEELAGSDRCKI
jgi:hypothetical protein